MGNLFRRHHEPSNHNDNEDSFNNPHIIHPNFNNQMSEPSDTTRVYIKLRQ